MKASIKERKKEEEEKELNFSPHITCTRSSECHP
jgi:2'-5' RNA ligase